MFSSLDLPRDLSGINCLQLLLYLLGVELGPADLLLQFIDFAFELALLALLFFDAALEGACLFFPLSGNPDVVILPFFKQSHLLLHCILLQLQMIDDTGLL